MKSETLFDRTPKHERLKEVLRELVVSGQLRPGDKLESEAEMCERYGVSRSTVREAIGSLVHEGLVVRGHGKGTFVAERKRENLVIGCVLPHLYGIGGPDAAASDDINPWLLHALENEVKRNVGSILLCLDNDEVERERENLLRLIDSRVDGAIVFYIGGQDNIDCLERVQQTGTPLVLIDRRVQGLESNYVITDGHRGAYQAVNTLIDHGFSTVYHFTIACEVRTAQDRLEGYRQALADRGMPVTADRICYISRDIVRDNEEEAYQIALNLFRTATPPFAVFAANTGLMTGAYRAIRELGIPSSEFALATFDEPSIAIPEDVFLIKVLQPFEQMARRSVDIVVAHLQGNRAVQHVVLDTQLVVSGAPTLV